MKQIYLCILSFFFSASCFPQWQQLEGPNGGYIDDIVRIGSVLVAEAGNAGIFRSSDNGGTWEDSNIGLPPQARVEALYTFKNSIYAAIYQNGVYQSVDEGTTWFSANSSERSTFYSLHVDESGIYGANANGGITISKNDGLTWTYVGVGISNIQFQDFARFESKLYAAGQSLYESSDNGASWQKIDVTGLGPNGVRSMIAHEETFYIAGDGEILISNDGLESFRKSTLNTSATITSIKNFGNRIYVTTAKGKYYYTEDEGFNWTLVQNLSTDSFVNDLIVLNEKIIMSTSEGLFSSNNEGANWSFDSFGIRALQIKAIYAKREMIFAGTESQGMFKSSDYGNTWSLINNGLNALNSTSINEILKIGNELYLATGGGVYKSENEGESWVRKLDAGINNNVNVLAYDNGLLVAGVSGLGIYISEDNSETWRFVQVNLLDGVPTSWATLAIYGSTIAIGNVSGNLFISEDLGATWKDISIAGVNSYYSNNDLEFFNNKLYAATSRGLFVTQNLGEDWKLFNNQTFNIRDILLVPTALYGATDQGLLVTSETHGQWFPVNSGLGGTNLTTLFLNENDILVGTFSSSVWQLPAIDAELPLLPCQPISSPWMSGDIGEVALAGTSCYNTSENSFEVVASGADIWGDSDEFHYVYQELTGDGEIVARVDELTYTHPWAKAGVMMRNSTEADAAQILMSLSPNPINMGIAYSLQDRPTKGATMYDSQNNIGPVPIGSFPYYVRLVRDGNNFSGYASATNGDWTLLGTKTIPMDEIILVGLATTSHRDGLATLATYSEVKVEEGDQSDRTAFITTWKTGNEGVSSDNQITIPTLPGEAYDYSVYWGDGTSSTGVTGSITHTYLSQGTYRISITGNFPGIFFNGGGDAPKITSVNQWGDTAWTSMESAFEGCSNLDIVATDKPDFSKVLSMESMFYGCNKLVGNNSFNNWDVSNVTNMSFMFFGTPLFNQAIGSWDVSNITNMRAMFFGGYAFNQDLGSWDVSKVANMRSMFYTALLFNQDISAWDVGNVTDMQGMFTSAYEFNQNLSEWNVENVREMTNMFAGARKFNQNIGNWDVGQVGSMFSMFNGASSFNQDLGNWNIGGMANRFSLQNMFFQTAMSTENYDKLLLGWSTLNTNESIIPRNLFFSNVELAYCLGEEAKNMLVNTYGWIIKDAGKSADCIDDTSEGIFLEAECEKLGNFWDSVEDGNASGGRYIVAPEIGTSEPPSSPGYLMEFKFNADEGDYKIFSLVKTPSSLSDSFWVRLNEGEWIDWNSIQGSDEFSWQPIHRGQNVADIVTFNLIQGANKLEFAGQNAEVGLDKIYLTTGNAAPLAQGGDANNCSYADIKPFVTTWRTNNYGSSNDNQITIPTTSAFNYNYNVEWGDGTTSIGVTGDITHDYAIPGIYQVSISGNFPAIRFAYGKDNQKILSVDAWGDIEWYSMFSAFQGCINLDIKATDIPDFEDVINFQYTFGKCRSLIGTPSMAAWRMPKVSATDFMFNGAELFNQDISTWDVSNIKQMRGMFQDAKSFNQDLNDWNVSGVTDFTRLFYRANAFNQSLKDWDIGNARVTDNIFDETSLSQENYDEILIGWSTLDSGENNIPRNLNLGAGDTTFCLGEEARQKLVDDFGWTIADGGLSDECVTTCTSLPLSWTGADIGVVAAAGTSCYNAAQETFEVTASGADIWGTNDEFHYVYQELIGDGEIVARVDGLTNTHPWAKAGVMMRNNTASDAAQILMSLSPNPVNVGIGYSLQDRPSKGVYMRSDLNNIGPVPVGNFPYYVRLVRKGNNFSGYASATNGNWTLVGTKTIPMNDSILVGLATTSHRDGTLTKANYSEVSIKRGIDVIENNPPEIFLEGDEFVLLFSGDPYIELGATAIDIEDGDLSDFIRIMSTVDSTRPGIYEVYYFVSDFDGASSTEIRTVFVEEGPDFTPPVITLIGPESVTLTVGETYTELGATAIDDVDGDITQDLIVDGTSVNASIPGSYSVTYNVTDAFGNSAIEKVRTIIVIPEDICLPLPWRNSDIGAVAVAGAACYDSSQNTFEVTASGADIWGSSDEFHYVYQRLTGDGEIIARVDGLTNTHPWAKAGVMMRNGIEDDAAQILMSLSTNPVNVGIGYSLQDRPSKGAIMNSVANNIGPVAVGSFPYYVRLIREGNKFTGYASPTKGNWTLVGTKTIAMEATILVGLATTSHRDGTITTANYAEVELLGATSTAAKVEGSLAEVNSEYRSQNNSNATILSQSVLEMRTYPNPTSDMVNVSFGTILTITEFQIYDVNGRLVSTQRVDASLIGSDYQLDVIPFETGTYFLRAYDVLGRVYQKQLLVKR